MKRTILLTTLLLAGCSGSGLSTSSGPNGETIVGNDVSVQVTGAANPNRGLHLGPAVLPQERPRRPRRRPVRHHSGVRLREGRLAAADASDHGCASVDFFVGPRGKAEEQPLLGGLADVVIRQRSRRHAGFRQARA